MIISNTQWTIDPSTFGLSLEEFATTKLPQNTIKQIANTLNLRDISTETTCIYDLCTPPDLNGACSVNIVPFSRLSDYVKAGDLVVFVEKKAQWDTSSVDGKKQILKQRGWHAELITMEEGKLYIRGVWGEWGGASKRFPISDLKCHEMLRGRESWFNLHVFRFESIGQNQVLTAALTQNLEAWVKLFPAAQWPSQSWDLDPVDFDSTEELRRLGDQLISTENKPDMFCVQWVHAILCLAMCYPLTETFLSRRGVTAAFREKIAEGFLLQNDISLFDHLPIAPYSPSDVIKSFVFTYLGGATAINFDAKPLVSKLEDLFGIEFPAKTILPITPLLECRHPACMTNFSIKYVVTSLADEFCCEQ